MTVQYLNLMALILEHGNERKNYPQNSLESEQCYNVGFGK